MEENDETENFLDKELDDLNKVIQSANALVQQMNNSGANPFAMMQQQMMGNVQQQPLPVMPLPSQLVRQTHILHCVNKSTNPIPKFAKPGDSGFDLSANLEQPILLKPMTMEVIPTGLFFEVEEGMEIQIRSRSGLARKNQLFVMNQPGTIDSGYRGEIEVMLFNLGKNEIQINHGDRIAQGVVCPVIGSGKLTILEAKELTQTERGSGGFGHTGMAN